MKPGATTLPRASIVRPAPIPSSSPGARILSRSPVIARSPVRAGAPVPSTIVPPAMSMSELIARGFRAAAWSGPRTNGRRDEIQTWVEDGPESLVR